MRLNTDIVIVGSGVGGATVAKELAIRGREVLVVERGHWFPRNCIGAEFSTRGGGWYFYDKHGVWCTTREGVFYYRTFMVGGTSVGSCGNGVRAFEKELKNLGIDLTEEFSEAERELNIKPIPDKFIGKGTRRIMEAAQKLGFNMEPMPKFIDFERCSSCGHCYLYTSGDVLTLPHR